MTARALTFGAAAAAYERYRPGYPDELADTVLAYAGRPVRTALEVGAGTGKATRLFAGRGIRVTATDPDADMLAELRRQVPAEVTVVRAAFEDLAPAQTYELVFAAASLHWTAPAGRWERVAALLEPGGVFASFGAPLRLADPALAEAVRSARAPFLADDEVPAPDGTPEDATLQWPGTELVRADAFTDVRQVEVARRPTVPARDYVGHLATVSAYLALPGAVRERALAAVLAVLPDRVTLDADLTVHLARRR
ncbi:class I SAM-dependent methyltransferase [Xylanimonas protaetiae]|uniref:Class I SAM-dependent methyltransferase n=1 Tax=Xylanimonas protaetiae TaxID=2509457 RepID=A0A4P6F5F6_9MICO|nr:class I SAM-dependent methyltransferase [Xylanimonas protaetiae]QAY71190.1 class I SAM-dependent methyltransferase [Xylanimonas protaetiae]